MPLSNKQKALVKQAQRDAGLSDAEYRESWRVISGQLSVISSTDPRLTDEHFDAFMRYVEAIYWRQYDQRIADDPLAMREWTAVFNVRGYWRLKNNRRENSRDRFINDTLGRDIIELERQMAELGCGPAYCDAIRLKVGGTLRTYTAALRRTLKSKRKKILTTDGHG